MGILDLFRKKDSSKVRLSELGSWLEAKRKTLTDKKAAELGPLANRLNNQIAETRHGLTKLKGAELFNKKISEREIQIMQGNREAYLQKTAHFLATISSAAPASMQQIPDFLELFNREFELLVKSTQKSYYVLSQFFGNEAGEVASGIKAIEKTKTELSHLDQSRANDMAPLDRLGSSLENLTKVNERIGKLKSELRQAEADQKQLFVESKKADKELEQLQQTHQYKEYLKLKEDYVTATATVGQIEEFIAQDFAPMEKAMRKFAKNSPDELFIMDYLSNPASALVSDQELYIITILDKLSSELYSGRLEVKDRVHEKTMSKLNQLSRDYLADLIAKHNEATSKKNLLSEELEAHKAGQALSGIQARQDKLVAQLSRIDGKLHEMQAEISRNTLQALKSEVKQVAEAEFGLVVVD